MRFLLAAGAEPNRVSAPYEGSPLSKLTASPGSQEVARLMLEAGAAPDGGGGAQPAETPLNTATQRGFTQELSLLLEYGADAGLPDMVALLLRQAGCSPDQARENGFLNVAGVTPATHPAEEATA